MTQVVFFRTRDDQILGFVSEGHSGFAEEGEDIVCAAVSVLTINTVNSIERLTDARILCDEDPDYARISFETPDYEHADVQLLLQSMALGLRDIEQSYGTSFIEVSFKEV